MGESVTTKPPRKPRPITATVKRERGGPGWELGLKWGEFVKLESEPGAPEEVLLAEADEALAAHGYRRTEDWKNPVSSLWGAQARQVPAAEVEAAE